MRRRMRAGVAAGVAMAALAAWPQGAGASSDYSCSPDWTLNVSAYDCAGTALIGPRNDTRINLALLLRDRASTARTTAAGRLAYPARDWDTSGFGHVFMDWTSLQASLWPATVEANTGAARSDYTGTRCQTLDSGGAAFQAALAKAKGLKPGERELLWQARALVKPACDGDRGAAAWPAGIASPAGLAWLSYLQAARAFYADDFATARSRYAELIRARDPWLAETARYMVARNELAAAQAHAFDEWGMYLAGKVDKAAANRAGDALDGYLAAHPRGRYAASAQGLTRRAVWLLGDGPTLARTYSGLLVRQPQASGALIEEVETKLLFGTGLGGIPEAPLLLATWDLLRMRPADAERSAELPAPISAAELATQQPVFAKAPDLYAFLQASLAYHVSRDDRRVLVLIRDDARNPHLAPLSFSRQLLRGLALERLGDASAAGFWRQLMDSASDLYQRPAAELAWALNRERAGSLTEVFAAQSPSAEPEIRALLLYHVAGPDLLRSTIDTGAKSSFESDIALFTLLFKNLSRGRYEAFGKDLALVPATGMTDGWIGNWIDDAERKVPVGLFARGRWMESFACPTLARTAATLAARPADPQGRLCLAEFYRLNGFDEYLADPGKPPPDELGGTPDQFPGIGATRADLYAGVLGNRSATPDQSAYALFRSISCYAPSGLNACGGDRVPESQRRAWFQRLKRDYATSKWSSELKYYW